MRWWPMTVIGHSRRGDPEQEYFADGMVEEIITDEGAEPQFHIRDTDEWKKLAGALEMEMLKRGMTFEVEG
jgi:TolB-like protein